MYQPIGYLIESSPQEVKLQTQRNNFISEKIIEHIEDDDFDDDDDDQSMFIAVDDQTLDNDSDNVFAALIDCCGKYSLFYYYSFFLFNLIACIMYV